MADGIDEAASAFETAISGNAPAPKVVSEAKGKPTERMFDNVGEFIPGTENDTAGGDEDQPVRRTKKPVEEEEQPEVFRDEESGQLYTIDDEGNPVAYEESEEDEATPPKKKGEEEDDDEEDPEYEVMVDGEPATVKLSEALRGYIGQKTLHTRMNQLADVKNVLATEAQKVAANRDKYINLLKDAEEQIALIIPAEPDWDAEFKANPERARNLQKQYDALNAKKSEIATKRKEAEDNKAKEDAAQVVEFAKSEFKRFANVAKWRNKEEMGKDVSSMRRTALAADFEEDEIATTYDSRMLTILLKASKYDRIMANKPKLVKRDGKSITPGVGSNRTAPKGNGRAMERLRKTGSVQDAAAAFKSILKL